MEFKELGFSDPVMESLQRLGFTNPTPIQEQAIPPLLQGRDLLGRAETGSGKTLAFGLPLIERVDAARVSIQALVVCPTRELAQQVAEDLIETGKEKGVKVALVVGGVHVRTQRMQIPGKQVVVGTPGRIIDLLTDRFLPIEWVEYFVMDEFDRLLDMGFLDDIKKIVKRLPRERQTALFSATVPKMILREAANLLTNPVQVEIGSARRAVDTIAQRAIRTSNAKKLAIVEHILKDELANDGSVIIFCNTKRAVRLVDRELWAKNFSVAALSGDHEQSVRFKVMERFRNREIRVLVATDVAARGLDIDHIGHVINFDVPFETEDYVHRIGRTGRAGRDGVVTTLIGGDDYQKFDRIRRHIEQDIVMLSERCQPLTEGKPKRSRSGSKKPERTAAREESDSTAQESAEHVAQEEPAAVEQEAPTKARSDDKEGRPRRRRRRRGGDGEKAATEAPERAEEKPEKAEKPERKEAHESSNDERDGGGRRRRRGGRGRGRGKREETPNGEAKDNERRSDDKDKGSRDTRSRTDDDKDKSPRDPKSRTDGDKRRRGGRGRSSRRDGDGDNGAEAKKDDRKSRSGRGRGKGRSGERRGNRRSQSEHERWEREQLDRPVELIEDNWKSVDNFDKQKPEANRSRDGENDNAPAPFEESSKERAAIAGSGGRRGASKRRSRPKSTRDKSDGAAPRDQKDSAKKDSKPDTSKKSNTGRKNETPEKPARESDGDIIW